MKINLKFHKTLIKYTDVAEITLHVDNYMQLISALSANFPKLRKVISQIKNQSIEDNFGLIDLKEKRLLKSLDYQKKKIVSDELYLTPLVAGSKNGGNLQIILGAALVALSLSTFFADPSGTLATATFNAGVSLIISGVITNVTAMMEPDGPTDASTRGNDAFGSLQNTLNTGTPIPLVYGRHRVAGHFLSGEIRTILTTRSQEFKRKGGVLEILNVERAEGDNPIRSGYGS